MQRETLYSNKIKREAFADYYEALLATPKPKHIIHDWDSMFNVIDDRNPKLHKIKFSEKEIYKVISTMKIKSSPGSDNITPESCHKFIDILTPILTKVFNKAIEQKQVLYDKIEVIISALFKGGNRMKIKQYRPSLFCHCSSGSLTRLFIGESMIFLKKMTYSQTINSEDGEIGIQYV